MDLKPSSHPLVTKEREQDEETKNDTLGRFFDVRRRRFRRSLPALKKTFDVSWMSNVEDPQDRNDLPTSFRKKTFPGTRFVSSHLPCSTFLPFRPQDLPRFETRTPSRKRERERERDRAKMTKHVYDLVLVCFGTSLSIRRNVPIPWFCSLFILFLR